jgi:HAD superfamily hydrolase (TIGR01549 family)
MIQAVLFDLDDTLFDHQGCSRDALAAITHAHESLRAMPFNLLQRTHAGLLEELHGEVMLGRVSVDDARVDRFRRLLRAAGGPASKEIARELALMYRDTYRARRRAVAGAAQLLAAVTRHARIGIVSNNIRDEQEEKLQICGLDPFVDALVVSEEAQVSKPDPGIFRIALDLLQVEPARAVMVGDSWAADVVGARAAGIPAIWFNPRGAVAPDPDADVRQLSALEPADVAVKVILEPYRH